ncbi:MAG: hypothetical protein IPM70_04730 [Proteobacteria bacterium]|nr:hypothetical protein [Pseudomonadota bacterium]MBK7117454.1 hypothetical protein [Pseudomonadota bacterium]MBK9251223.1 hypothetical protein [Pseudomonadota bacterium]MCC6632675.1 hypothetical protein [Gammaproteobacteria bacterium]
MSEALLLGQRIDVIERGYEYLLAYAAQGRQDDAGTELRDTLARMHEALTGMQGSLRAAFADAPVPTGTRDFTDAVERDVLVARGAIGLVLGRERIASLLVDNFNASVHVRALLTDLFLVEQALKSPARG